MLSVLAKAMPRCYERRAAGKKTSRLIRTMYGESIKRIRIKFDTIRYLHLFAMYLLRQRKNRKMFLVIPNRSSGIQSLLDEQQPAD